jgi:hypothetical protein
MIGVRHFADRQGFLLAEFEGISANYLAGSGLCFAKKLSSRIHSLEPSIEYER